MKKVKIAFFKSILIVMFMLIVYVTYCSIFKIYKNTLNLKPVIIIIGSMTLIFLFVQFKRIINKLSEKQINRVAIIICIVFFILLIIFGSCITSIPVEDLSNIQAEAMQMMKNGGRIVTEEYFMKYPNQKFLTILVYLIYKIGEFLNVQNLKLFGMGVNAFFIALTAFLTYLTVKRMKNCKIGLITLLFYVINPVFYLYISYFYSDMLCIPFAIMGIYWIILSANEDEIKKKILMEIIATFFIIAGAKIRIVVLFLLISFLLYIVLSEEKWKEKIIQLICIILTATLSMVLFSTIIKNFDKTQNKEFEFPIFHWIMMGLNEEKEGIWNYDDYLYTYNNTKKEEKKKKDIEKIKERVQKLGIKGIISLSQKKLAVNWSNGDYDYLGKVLNTEQMNGLYNYISGNKRIFVGYYSQICKVAMFIILLLVIVKQYINYENIQIFLLISILGAFLFYLIWEVSSRYSLSFLPWLILFFGIGIENIEQIIEYKFFNKKRKQNLIELTLRIISIGVISFSIILIIVNYNKYSVEKNPKWDTRVMQWKEQGKIIETISNKKIEQSFKTNRKFNSISIFFLKNKVKTNTKYIFKLKNDKNKIIVKQEFTSYDVKYNDYTTFSFKNINPKKEKEYIIEIMSNDATQDNSIGIASFFQENYDTYPNGKVRIDGKDINADIIFKVQNRINRTYLSKKSYIFLSFVIILIELFAFYPYLNYNRLKQSTIHGL